MKVVCLLRCISDDLEVTVNESKVIQVDDYYPFGLTYNSYRRSTAKQNRFLYNDGTERIEELDLGVDMTAFRVHDPTIGRWWQIDPVEKYHESGYAWVTNNPILYNDPYGLDTIKAKDVDPATYDYENDVTLLPEIVITPDGGYPAGNPSRGTNNDDGYIYDKGDLKVRNSLLRLGPENIITAALLRNEKKDIFQPLTAHNYLKQADERAARMIMFGHKMFPTTPVAPKLPGVKPFSYSKLYNHSQSRANLRGVSPEAIKDARTNPLKVSKVKYDNLGRPSQTYTGRQATVVVNPNTGKTITTWVTGTKTLNKLSNGN